jgi:selenocysteine lyase/cysteine desulfurase
MTQHPSAVSDIRQSLIGHDAILQTPFGDRPLLYADYTASGRNLLLIEQQMQRLASIYANPHTQDSATGRSTGQWLRRAEATIKSAVNAGANDCLIACGAGATSAVHKLQEILGVALPPNSREQVFSAVSGELGPRGREVVDASLQKRGPVVFIGPYEHHSNELSWRESLAEVISIGLTADGQIDLEHLQRELCNPDHVGRIKLGAFSAASNVTGVKTDVTALARLLHAHGALLCLDCAASAPYLKIDMHPENDPQARIDVVYFSPHKFVGGPGACGVLIFDKAIYREDLPPTQSAGGTVKYVWKDGHDYIDDVEAREAAGTPGVPQVVRAALALQVQAEIGLETIGQREHAALQKAFTRWQSSERIHVLGPQCPTARVGIVSFNIDDPRGGVIHPRLVTVLLNDLFGIQSRAGCSCAGPYGHDLLEIDAEQTRHIRKAVLAGNAGVRPGWCRISLHWTMDEAEIDYLIDAVEFVAEHGWKFVDLYEFSPVCGQWSWRGECHEIAQASCFPSSLLGEPETRTDVEPLDRAALYSQAMQAAQTYAETLPQTQNAPSGQFDDELERVRFFTLPAAE